MLGRSNATRERNNVILCSPVSIRISLQAAIVILEAVVKVQLGAFEVPLDGPALGSEGPAADGDRVG